jgi:hypothetical protein
LSEERTDQSRLVGHVGELELPSIGAEADLSHMPIGD